MKKILLFPSIVAMSATPLIGLASCGNKTTTTNYPFTDILSSYKKMLTETIDTTYGDQDITIIQAKLTIVEDVEHFDEPTSIFYFNDINYYDGDRAIWPAHQHIVRALSIAVAADKETDQTIKEEKFNIATRLILYWLCHEYVNENWWFNEIGVPRDLSNIALFIWDRLTAQQQGMLLEWIHHGSFKYNPTTRSYTGTNTFWAGDITMKSAAIAKNPKEMDLMFKYVDKEIQVDQEEGFQSDGSYFQHGKMLYSGGYGRQGALILAKIASAFNDTDFRLNEDKLSIIVNFVLDGLRYMTHKGNFTWQCMGRTYTRKDASAYHPGVTDLGDIREFKYIANLPNCPRKDELQWLVNNWSKDATQQESNFEGVKYFPRSQFIACNFEGSYIGVKGATPDLVSTEMGNGENELGHNLAFGFNTCVIKLDGNSYNNISPVWDYSSIPGTTSPDEDDETLSLYDNDDMHYQQKGPSYGGFDEEANIAYIAQKGSQRYRDKTTGGYIGSVKYIITSFATECGVTVLGAGIDNTTGLPIHTTVDQYNTTHWDHEGDDKRFVCDSLTYENIEEGDDNLLHLDIEHRNESWYRNNHSYSLDDKIEKDVTTITLNNPSSSSYAYTIGGGPRIIKLVKNDTDAQAIHITRTNKVACMFWEDISFTYEGIKCEGKAGEFKIFPLNN